MKLYQFCCIIVCSVLFISCNSDLENQHALLQQREAELLEKEKRFALKETEYQSLIKMRDSLMSSRDTLVVVNPLTQEILGQWKGRIVTTESNCQEYVVGDTRVDDWEISELNGQIVAKNFNKKGIIRVYTGGFENNILKLTSKTEPDAPKHLDLNIDFTTVEAGKLSGTRQVQINKDCVSKFNIELLR